MPESWTVPSHGICNAYCSKLVFNIKLHLQTVCYSGHYALLCDKGVVDVDMPMYCIFFGWVIGVFAMLAWYAKG